MRQPVENRNFGDSELVKLSLAGDRDTFGHLVTRYQNLLWNIPMLILWRFVRGSRGRQGRAFNQNNIWAITSN